MPKLVAGYRPDLIATITRMHATYYANLVGFGETFETTVANGLSEFIPRLGNPKNQIWTVVKGNEILGSIAIDGQDLGANIAHLRWFIVSDKLRGGGWGRKLLQATTEFCDQQGFSETHLWTFSGLDAARRLYEINGFTLSEQASRRQPMGQNRDRAEIHPHPVTIPHLGNPHQNCYLPHMTYTIAALYHFTRFDDVPAIQLPLQAHCDANGVKGSLLIAHEGINGTIAGTRKGIDSVLAYIRALPGCADFEHKKSLATEAPFLRMKVKKKKEIVTMGQPQVDPTANVGNYVAPEDWNDLITSDDVVLIDTRNDYEYAIGTFEGAIDPETASFSEFPAWWEANKSRFHNKRVAMFCTGGIRCEKSTNYLLGEGVKDVFHLKGGILKYLEEIPEAQSTWNGECFVFDSRVSVGHGLAEGPYHLCYACRRPISDADMAKPEFEKGVSCHQCINEHDEDRRERFRERQKQVMLAEKRGGQHIGQQDELG